MKKLIILISCFALTLNATSQVYFGLNTNLSLPTDGRTLENLGIYNYSSSVNSITYEEVKTSFGGGAFTGATLGLRIDKSIAIELNAGYQFSNTIKSKNSYVNGAYDYTFKSRTLSLRPSLVFIFNENEKRFLYTKIGGVYNRGDLNLNIDGEQGGEQFHSETKFINGRGLGIQTAFGVNWQLNKNLSLLTELTYINLSLSPKSGEITRFEDNGFNLLDTMSVAEKQVEYLSEITFTSSTNASTPSKQLRFKVPFSGLGLNIGLKWTIDKGTKNDN